MFPWVGPPKVERATARAAACDPAARRRNELSPVTGTTSSHLELFSARGLRQLACQLLLPLPFPDLIKSLEEAGMTLQTAIRKPRPLIRRTRPQQRPAVPCR